jgi:hypothetical protein
MLIGAKVDFVFDVGLLKLSLCLEHFATVYACKSRHDFVLLQRSIHRKNIFGNSYIKIPEVQVTSVLASCDYVLRQSSILKRQPRWMRDQVWGSAKAQDFEAVLIMAAEALRKCEEANAERAVVAGNAPKKRRAKPELAAEGSVREYPNEPTPFCSAPSNQQTWPHAISAGFHNDGNTCYLRCYCSCMSPLKWTSLLSAVLHWSSCSARPPS